MRDWTAFVRAQLSLPELTPEREARIVRELAAQLEDFCREARARGETAEAADAYARAQIDDWTRMARELRRADQPHLRPRIDRVADTIHDRSPKRGPLLMLAHLMTDLRFAARQMSKTPGFTLVAILTLAFGIGATTAIFSVVNGVILRPLPYAEPDRLVRVIEILPQFGRFAVAPANFLDWRQQNSVFERIAAYAGGTDAVGGPEGPERIAMSSVSWDTFELLGVPPALGRGFRADEDLPNRNDVAVISHGMWQRRFGGDAAILGRPLDLSSGPVTIVGVMPPDFYFPARDVEFWRPIAFNPANATRGGHYISVVARLKPGVTVAAAGAEMKGIAERLAEQYPKTNHKESAETIAAHELIVGQIRPTLLTLLAAVAVVVLIACANVANLLLARASVREKEIAIRAAMGAGRGRLVLQMLAESLVLATAGGALGVLLAYLAIEPIQTLSAGSIPRVADVAIDRTVLLFAVLMSLATGLLFGGAPAWQASRSGPGAALKEGARAASSAGGRWLRSALLVGEVALSLVLLVSAVLLLRSFARLTGVDPGFQPEKVLTFRVSLPQVSYPDSHHRFAFYDRLLEKLRSTPGVEAAGMAQQVPMRGDYVLSFSIQGRPSAGPGTDPSANYRSVSPGYFESLGIPLRRGRLIDERDTDKAPLVAVVDEAFARRYFPGEDPIGRGIDIGNGTDGYYEIVGVVGDVHYGGLDATPAPSMYAPFKTDPFGTMAVVVRAAGDPAQLTGAARQAVREIDSALPAYAILPLSQVVSDSVAQRRFSMLLLALFAFVALFLAAVGLYGVVSYTVSLRTREIGVRMAIGAQRGDVLKLVVGGGMKLALAGTAIGIVAALALSRVVESMLYGVTPFDVTSYALTAAVLLAVSALACFVPARRATAVDPLLALRAE